MEIHFLYKKLKRFYKPLINFIFYIVYVNAKCQYLLKYTKLHLLFVNLCTCVFVVIVLLHMLSSVFFDMPSNNMVRHGMLRNAR